MFQDSSKIVEGSMAQECLEKRRSPRFDADCFVAVYFHDQRVIGLCMDWSEHGLGVVLEAELPVGKTLWVELPISGDIPLKVRARVVHQNGARHGFEFVNLHIRDRRIMENFFKESTEATAPSGDCRSRFGHVIRSGACIFCDWQPQ